jgi:hypothetical protein
MVSALFFLDFESIEYLCSYVRNTCLRCGLSCGLVVHWTFDTGVVYHIMLPDIALSVLMVCV